VEEGENLIQVKENIQEDSEPVIDCPTPVLDERPPPPEPTTTSPTPSLKDDPTPTTTTDTSTDTHIETFDIAIDATPIANVQDTGTSTDIVTMTDSACSPTHHRTTDTGTDPIVWWLEETRTCHSKPWTRQ
jgi:hypothetical protein